MWGKPQYDSNVTYSAKTPRLGGGPLPRHFGWDELLRGGKRLECCPQYHQEAHFGVIGSLGLHRGGWPIDSKFF